MPVTPHVLVTSVLRFDGARQAAVDDALAALGNPAIPAVTDAVEAAGVFHFTSLATVPAEPGRPAHLFVELTADGEDEEAALDAFARALAPWWPSILAAAGLSGDPATLLRDGRLEVTPLGTGARGAVGIPFDGAPGLSVAQIRDDARVAAAAYDVLNRRPRPATALEALNTVRAEVFPGTAPPAPDDCLPDAERSTNWLAATLRAFRPWYPAILAFAALGGLVALGVAALLGTRGWWLLLAFLAGAILPALALLALLRAAEKRDPTFAGPVDHARVSATMAKEGIVAQNHYNGISVVKPGPLRALMLRAAFIAIAARAACFAPGTLGPLRTIHSARWVWLPGTRQLVFRSNYGGSWESYLEDFIALASQGLTAIWSNTAGYPRTTLLFKDGATDGAAFKRWARDQQWPTPFWFTAHPRLNTSRVRINLRIHRGLLTITDEAGAREWLSLFSGWSRPVLTEQTPVPDHAIEPGETWPGETWEDVQSLAYTGFGTLRSGSTLLLALPAGREREWIAKASSRLAFGTGRHDRAATLGLSFAALRAAGVPDAELDRLPTAFREGMTAPHRSRALGDEEADAPDLWWWGGPNTPAVDAALLLHAADEAALAAEEAWVEASGATILHRVALARLPDEGLPREPFGFTDGIANPVIAGRPRKGNRRRHPDHDVAPGEILLGRRDGLGYPRAGTAWGQRCEPPRFAEDGSFLVLRQIEQHVAAFHDFCAVAARQLQDRGDPDLAARATPEWVAAKAIGRWPDGSSLTLHPEGPSGGSSDEEDMRHGRDDPRGIGCPFGAHIRRANPRDSQEPGSAERIAITNRHRVLRVGRRYAPLPDGTEGLMFACLNADIERQFEFIQQTWSLAPSFHGLEDELDPIVGRRTGTAFTIPTPRGPQRVTGVPDVVTIRGGGYFLMPSRAGLRMIADAAFAPAPRRAA